MRNGHDALRSLQRYIASVLNEPPLAEAVWTDAHGASIRWSPGLVAGDFDVDAEGWRFLLTHWTRLESRTVDGVEVGAARLGYDPRPAASSAGIDLGSAPVAQTLVRPPGWEVILMGDRSDPVYPFCLVKPAGPALSVGTALYADCTQPMHLNAYPSDVTDDVRAATLEAERVRDQLVRGVMTGVGLGRPRRIPLYDYDLVGPSETSDVRVESDFLRVVDFSAELLPEPADPRQIAVVADMRVTWRREAGLSRGIKTVQSVRLQLAEP